MSKRFSLQNLTVAAACLALCIVLPFLTGQIKTFGEMLSPMHIGVFLCGFLCGFPYGLGVGLIAPLLRSFLFGMPPLFPGAVAMAFELATYGAVSGLLYKILPKKIPYLYVSLIGAMIAGRAVWGVVRFLIAGFQNTTFPMAAFLSGALFKAWPGIILQIVLIPAVVMAVKRNTYFRRGD